MHPSSTSQKRRHSVSQLDYAIIYTIEGELHCSYAYDKLQAEMYAKQNRGMEKPKVVPIKSTEALTLILKQLKEDLADLCNSDDYAYSNGSAGKLESKIAHYTSLLIEVQKCTS
jgi:hypothetical protein